MLARAGQFQAAWYFSLLLFAILLLVVLGTGYALLGVRRLWRSGAYGPAAMIAGAVTLSFLSVAGFYAVAIGWLVAGGSGA
jgi:hypothetical protein